MTKPWYMEFKNFQHPGFTVLMLSLILLTTPGVLVIFIFSRSLFDVLDSVKLVLLSISLISPFVAINTLVFTETIAPKGEEKSFLYATFFLSIIISGVLLYAFAGAGMLGWSLKASTLLVLGCELGTIGAAYLEKRSYNKQTLGT